MGNMSTTISNHVGQITAFLPRYTDGDIRLPMPFHVISQNVNAWLANRSHSSRINRIRFQPLLRFTTIKHGVVYFLTVQCKNNSMQEGKQNREWNRLNSNCKLLLAGETCSAVATPAATQQILYCAKGRVVHCHNTNFARHHNFEFWSGQCWPEFPLLSIQRINVTKLTRYVCM